MALTTEEVIALTLQTVNTTIAQVLEQADVIERHIHTPTNWFGLAVTPDGELHRADAMVDYTNTNVINPFQIDAGNNNWGAWVQILGSGDTPYREGQKYFDLDFIQIVDSEDTNVSCFVQISSGETPEAGCLACDYTTLAYLTPTNQSAESAIETRTKRYLSGTKVWARCLAVGENTMTLDFYFGLHEYED